MEKEIDFNETRVAARRCPNCEADSKVYDSRAAADGTITRFRICRNCGTKFSTLEQFLRIITDKKNK